MTYEAKIQLVRPRTDPTGQPIGWSPSYIQGFYDALAVAAQIGRKADAHIGMLRKMLLYVHQEGGIDGWVGVANDRYEYAMSAARENGNEEPTVEDEINGILMMLYDAMRDSLGPGTLDLSDPPVVARCACGARAHGDCPGAWEPGCDLGANAAHAQPVPAPRGLDDAFGFRWRLKLGVQLAGRSVRITNAKYNSLSDRDREDYEPI